MHRIVTALQLCSDLPSFISLPKQTWPLFDWSTCPWACWCSRPPPWCSPWDTPGPCRVKVHATSPPQLWCWPSSWRSSPVCCLFSRSTVSSWLIKVLSAGQKLAGLPAINPALLIKFAQNLAVRNHGQRTFVFSGFMVRCGLFHP